jgi:hypothetical protein
MGAKEACWFGGGSRFHRVGIQMLFRSRDIGRGRTDHGSIVPPFEEIALASEITHEVCSARGVVGWGLRRKPAGLVGALKRAIPTMPSHVGAPKIFDV